jgi:hypothetical protein
MQETERPPWEHRGNLDTKNAPHPGTDSSVSRPSFWKVPDFLIVEALHLDKSRSEPSTVAPRNGRLPRFYFVPDLRWSFATCVLTPAKRFLVRTRPGRTGHPKPHSALTNRGRVTQGVLKPRPERPECCNLMK